MRPGDTCDRCEIGRIGVRWTKLLCDRRYRQRHLECDTCFHSEQQIVPVDAQGREMLAGKRKVIECPCCNARIEIDDR